MKEGDADVSAVRFFAYDNNRKRKNSPEEKYMLTTGTEFTTAATDLVNAAAAAGLLYAILKERPLTKHSRLWAATYLFFIGVCLAGVVLHGLVITPQVKKTAWCFLYVIMVCMVQSYCIAVRYDIFGEKGEKKYLVRSLVLAGAAAAVLVSLLLFSAGNDFLVFSAYCAGNMVYIILKLLPAIRKRSCFRWYIAAVALLITGSLLQAVRSIHIRLIWEFDRNSVYHFFLFLFILCQYRGMRLWEKARDAES